MQAVSGKVCEYEESYGGHYYTLTDVNVNDTEIPVKIRVYNSSDIHAQIDDTIKLEAAVIYELGESSGAVNNYKANNIYIGASNKGAISVFETQKHSLDFYLSSIRDYVKDSLSPIKNKNLSSVAVATITGEQSGVDSDTLSNFRYSGISHLFAVSGFHLTLWTSAINTFFARTSKKKKRIPIVISVIFVLFFMALTGFTKSVTRAGIMMLVLLAGKLMKRRSDTLNSLFCAGALILIENPFAVMSASLQLSFLSTLGIIVMSEPLNEFVLKIKKKIRNTFVAAITEALYTNIAISIAASLFTLPVSAISFGYFSLWAPITNLLCLSAGQGMMITGALASIFSPVTAISKPLLILTSLLSEYIVFVTEKIAKLPTAVADASTIGEKAVFTLLIVVLMLVILILRKNNKHLRVAVAVSYSCVLTVALFMHIIQADNVKITVADVDNGTAVVCSIKGNDLIIGCGGSEYKEYKLTNAADLNNTMQYDLLIIPRNTTTESAYAGNVIKRYSFDKCICNSDKTESVSFFAFPENTLFTDYCTLELDENCKLVYINNDDFSGVRIEADNFSCTIIFYPKVDFSAVDESWQQGDLLISRQALPDIDLQGFETVIISSSQGTPLNQSNIYSTADSGQIIYKTYPFSFTLTEANK